MNSQPSNMSFQDGLQFAWDATSITLAEECLRKYKYKLIDGWQRDGRPVHLRFGGHYATALEHFYKHRALGLTIDEALEEVVFEALVDTWDRTEENPDGAPWDSGHNTKTRENLIRTIVWYVAQFGEEKTTVVQLANGKPAVELSFSFEVSDDIVFCGHLDRLVEYASDPYVMDQKTTQSTITPRYFEGYNPDIQMSMYTFAGKAVFGIPVKGVIIDAASIMVGFTRFERGFTFRSSAQLDEWFDNSMLTVEAARKATRENYFPMNRTSCGNYGGCEFREICSRSPEVRPQFLAGGFTRGERWDPIKRR